MQISAKSLFILTFIVNSVFVLAWPSLLISENWLFENQQEAIAQPQPANNTINIRISSPENGSQIRCQSRRRNASTRRDQCFFSVTGTVSNLPPNSYISLMLQVPGTSQWWRAGNSIRPTNRNWSISMASVDLGQPFREIEGIIIVTNRTLPNRTSPYEQLPSNQFKTPSYLWKIP